MWEVHDNSREVFLVMPSRISEATHLSHLPPIPVYMYP